MTDFEAKMDRMIELMDGAQRELNDGRVEMATLRTAIASLVTRRELDAEIEKVRICAERDNRAARELVYRVLGGLVALLIPLGGAITYLLRQL